MSNDDLAQQQLERLAQMQGAVGAAVGEVFDLDAVAREARGEPFRFRFGGELYTLPPALDMRVPLALEAGRLRDALELLLGEDQWQRLLKSKQILDDKTFVALFDRYAKHLGLGASGESSASSATSGSTGRPSSRISNGSTV